jgi:hypothetical protein
MCTGIETSGVNIKFRQFLTGSVQLRNQRNFLVQTRENKTKISRRVCTVITRGCEYKISTISDREIKEKVHLHTISRNNLGKFIDTPMGSNPVHTCKISPDRYAGKVLIPYTHMNFS